MIRPLGDKVVVEPVEASRMIGSVHLPDVAQEKPARGKVIAVGPDAERRSNGDPRGQRDGLDEGDVVLFSKYGGTTVQIGEKDFLVLRLNDVLAILDDE